MTDVPLQEQVAAAIAAARATPQALAPRMALFQLAAVTGDWARARSQLETLRMLDPDCAMLARVYGRLIDAEATRCEVFAGAAPPVAFGPPTPWLAMLADALRRETTGEVEAARRLRAAALDTVPARGGIIEGERFAWIMDADDRLGPVIEAVIDGQYRWLPFEHLQALRAEPPRALRDLVWQPATLTLVNGQDMPAFLPARYPGSARDASDAVRLGRETRWLDTPAGPRGLGQRMLASDLGDHALLDLRSLRLEPAAAAADV